MSFNHVSALLVLRPTIYQAKLRNHKMLQNKTKTSHLLKFILTQQDQLQPLKSQ